METIGNTLGNTSNGARIVPSKYWCWTYYPTETLETEIKVFKEIMAAKGQYIFGIETCPTTGKTHFQGYIEFNNKVRPIESVKIKEIHWEKRKGTKEQNIIYCSKEGKIHTNMKLPKPLKDPMEGLELYDWQDEINNLVYNEPHNRKIYWYWENTGNVGKTTFAKHLLMKHNSILLSGKASDIKNGIAKHIETYKEIDLAIFHYTRSQEDYISYEALESIKDGVFFSGKYESTMCLFNPPHVIVFANFKPDTKKLSSDRWVIRRIGPEEEPEDDTYLTD